MTLRFTPISDIEQVYHLQRSLSDQREFTSPKERIAQLKRLRKSISQHEVVLLAALKKDLGKSNYEGFLTEIGVTYQEIDFHIKHVKHWSAHRRITTPWFLLPSSSKVIPEPFGQVLIMAPWNYPFQLLMNPLIGAISAGNRAILRPSPEVPTVAAVAMLAEPVTTIDVSLLDLAPATALSPTDQTPTVRVAEAERSAAESRIAVERTRSRPDVSASVGLRRYEAEDATALTFGLSLPLPLFDRNRGNIEAAQADFRAADARLMTARQEAQADRAAAQARLRASVSRVNAADAGVTSAEEAYRLSRIGFEAGRISQLELRATRTALVNARTAAVDARLARVRAEIDLARLDGRAPFQGAQ